MNAMMLSCLISTELIDIKEDLKKFGNVGEFQKNLVDKFFYVIAKCLRIVRYQQERNR